MIPLASLLKRALVRANVDKVVEAAQVVDTAQALLNERFGTDAGITVRSFQKKVLVIGVNHAAARAELMLASCEILGSLNQALGKTIVKGLRFR